MKDTLKQLQALQEKALEKGIYSFQINSRVYDDGEQSIWVTVFKKGDDSEGDYLSLVIRKDRNPKYIIMELEDFIGGEE